MWAMKISDNPLIDETEPEVLITAIHHAVSRSAWRLFSIRCGHCSSIMAPTPTLRSWSTARGVLPPVRQSRRLRLQRDHRPVRRRRSSAEPGGMSSTQTLASIRTGITAMSGITKAIPYNRSSSLVYRGDSAFSEPENQNMRDFVDTLFCDRGPSTRIRICSSGRRDTTSTQATNPSLGQWATQ